MRRPLSRRPSRQVLLVVLAAFAAAGLAGCDRVEPVATPTTTAATAAVQGEGTVGDGATPAAPPTPVTSAPPAPAEPPTPDQLAGLLSHDVPPSGDGQQVLVPGRVPAPPAENPVLVAVAVEGGVPVDGQAFADFVITALNDPRGWGPEGYSFGRTDDPGAADVTVVLASPELTDRLCRPLRTFGKVSCRNGATVALTHHRWVLGTPDYADDLTAYRQYLVNHEVGHFLGKGHVGCPQAGARAPVMLQQTLGLQGCARNPWPYP